MSMTVEQFEEGMMAYKLKDFTRAEAAFKAVLAQLPYSSETMLNLGNVYYRQQKYMDAETQWQKALDVNPMEEKVYLSLGNLYYSQQNMTKAVYYWEIYLSLDPLCTNVMMNLGMAYEALGKLTVAYRYYQAYIRSQRFSTEAEHLKQRMEQAKELAGQWVVQAQYSMGKGDLKLARQAYEECVKLVPLQPKIYKAYAALLYTMKDYEAAIRWYEEAVHLAPNDVGAWVNMGICYEKTQNPFHAIWCYTMAKKQNLGATPEVVRHKVKDMWEKQGADLCTALFTKVEQGIAEGQYYEMETLANRLFDVALAYGSDLVKQAKGYAEVLELRREPKKLAADIAYSMAESFREKNQYHEALVFYERYLELLPEGQKADEIKSKHHDLEAVVSAVMGVEQGVENAAIGAA